ncbi:MAG: helix-turn-helix domain-containing protein [Bacteroides sp.]|nr:helix-turn-helix domain-containing protein [Bacteroides sp.]
MEENKTKKESNENTEINPTFDQVHEGLNVRTARQALGYTQKELAAKLNEEPKNISNLELQKVINNEALLNKIVNFLKISIEWVRIHCPLKDASIHNYNDSIVQNSNSNPIQNRADEITNVGIPLEEYKELIQENKELTVKLVLIERDLSDAQKRIAELENKK